MNPKTQVSLAGPVFTDLGIEGYESRSQDEEDGRCYLLFLTNIWSQNGTEWIRASEVQEVEGFPDIYQGQVQPIEHQVAYAESASDQMEEVHRGKG